MHFSASTFMVPYLHQYYAVLPKMHFFGAIWGKFALYYWKFSIIIKKVNAETTHSKASILLEFSEQHQHQSIKKHQIECPISNFLVKIRCRFNTHFIWDLVCCKKGRKYSNSKICSWKKYNTNIDYNLKNKLITNLSIRRNPFNPNILIHDLFRFNGGWWSRHR